MERLFIEVFSQVDAEGGVYWTAKFLNATRGVDGKGETPEKAVTELFDNWRVWRGYGEE